MLQKQEGLRCRQTPLQKAVGWGESALKFVGGARAIYDAGQNVYQFGKFVAPYAQSAVALL